MLIHLSLLLAGAHAPAIAPHAADTAATDTAAAAAALTTADAVADLLSTGKRALLRGDLESARTAFGAAHEKEGSLRTEVWVLRGQLAAGELDEAFDRIITLEADGKSSAGLSYVIGVARYDIAKREESKRGGNPGGAYEEAAAYLEEATSADEEAFPDAWRMLAASARWVGKADLAARAIDRAMGVSKDAETLVLAAKIRISKGAAMMGSEETKDAGQRAIEQGIADATAAVDALGTKKANAATLADVQLQRAVGLLYLGKKDDAAGAYTAAMEWDPTQVDFGQLYGTYKDENGSCAPFVKALESGAAAFEKRWGKRIASDAGLLWWLGYGQYELGRYEASIASMEGAVAKFPAYANAHWYIALSHWFQGKEQDVKAAESFRAFAEADRAGFAAMVNASAQNKAYPGRVLGRLYGNNKFEEAADLSEVRLMADENDPTLWNDVGLMHRDAGEFVLRSKKKEPRMAPEAYFERSWEAYQKALELDRKSYYLNDGAVLLHYYLERDYDLAIKMYDEAEAMAQAALDKGGLSAQEKPLVEIALRDSKNNRAALRRKIEKAAKDKKGADGAPR